MTTTICLLALSLLQHKLSTPHTTHSVSAAVYDDQQQDVEWELWDCLRSFYQFSYEKLCVFPCSLFSLPHLAIVVARWLRFEEEWRTRREKTFIFMIIFLCRFDLWFLPFFQESVEWMAERMECENLYKCSRVSGGWNEGRAIQHNVCRRCLRSQWLFKLLSHLYFFLRYAFLLSLKANAKPPHLVKLKGESCNKK